jgi:hypothetical protein
MSVDIMCTGEATARFRASSRAFACDRRAWAAAFNDATARGLANPITHADQHVVDLRLAQKRCAMCGASTHQAKRPYLWHLGSAA